jgi:uncharacterized membrane protein
MVLEISRGDEENMSQREKGWGLIVLILVILGYVLPFTVLREITHWYGSFLVWVLLAIVVIIINVIMTKGWGDQQ